MRLLSILALCFCLLSPAWAATKAEVTATQERLAELGFNPGPIDGQLGPKTRRALRNFQRSKNLHVTGHLNDPTEFALGLGAKMAGIDPDATEPEVEELDAEEITEAEPEPEPEAVEEEVAVEEVVEEEPEIVAAPPKRFGFVIEGVLEGGGDEIFRGQLQNGDSVTLDAGQGGTLAAGIFFRIPNSNISFKHTLGYKFAFNSKENGDVRVGRIASDLVGRYHVGKHWKFGLGATFHFNNELDVDIPGDRRTVKFDNAIGYTAEVQWRWIGLSYTDIDYKEEVSKEKVDASSVGLFFIGEF